MNTLKDKSVPNYIYPSVDYKLGPHVITLEEQIGNGYSGAVYAVRDIDGNRYAFKLTKATNNKRLAETIKAEYDKLVFLSQHETIQVPRPLGLYQWFGTDGKSQSGILMDLIQGVTLREWVNRCKKDSYTDPLSQRTIHPVFTVLEAVRRIDVALAVIKAVSDLKEADGHFVDLKPRNLMIYENLEGIVCTLVDAGGIILAKDLPNWQKTSCVHPATERYSIETTSSYLSPEVATIVLEHDCRKGKLHHHFKKLTFEDSGELPDHYASLRRHLKSFGVIRPQGIVLTERSTTFILGLILVELLGGGRTGLTALTRQALLQHHFAGQNDVEFRCVSEWNHYVPALGCDFFTYYRNHCYPQFGLFTDHSGGGFGKTTLKILDDCLSFSYAERPSLQQLRWRLENLRLLADEENATVPSDIENKNSNQTECGLRYFKSPISFEPISFKPSIGFG